MDETLKPKMSPKDFFLHLGVIVVLYVVVGFLLNLLFTVINTAYPQVNAYANEIPFISLPVAALIVLFPLFITLSWLTYRSYRADQSKKQLGVRKWLTYLTLFVTGAVIAGDLITVIYYFLDGRDFTASFVLKALSVVVVTAMIFGYYLFDLRDKVMSSQRKLWASVSGILVLATIVVGFTVIGSPKTQRLLRIDEQKVNDLQSIQWQIVNYWQGKQKLPQTLNDLNETISGFVPPTDTDRGIPYVYQVTAEKTFKLCAEFNLASRNTTSSINGAARPIQIGLDENWQHGPGRVCFDRSIDPQLYPPKVPAKI